VTCLECGVTQAPRRKVREWREKSDWNKDIPEFYLTIYTY